MKEINQTKQSLGAVLYRVAFILLACTIYLPVQSFAGKSEVTEEEKGIGEVIDEKFGSSIIRSGSVWVRFDICG